MSRFLLDSDVIIWHLRGSREVTELLRNLQKFSLPGCSAVSVFEVQMGVKRGEEEATNRFLKALKIFDVTGEVADRSAQLVREYQSRGRTLGVADALIAGTCLLHNLTLVTYNRKHYPIAELDIYPVLPLE
jgi:predicted nucleic acid-binding protein